MNTLAPESIPQLTPMMQQYQTFREQIQPGTLLLYRLGDFFELFFEDARIGSQVLGLTLTQRGDVPMAGIPAYTVDNHVPKLLAAGYRVAVADQVEAAQAGKLVRRAITRILTPGTSCEAGDLETKTNNFLLSFNWTPKTHMNNGPVAAAWADVASGEIVMAQVDSLEELLPVLMSLPIREILVPEGARKLWAEQSPVAYSQISNLLSRALVTDIPTSRFDVLEGHQSFLKGLQVNTLAAFGIEDKHRGLGPAGAILYYTSQTFCQTATHFHNLKLHKTENVLSIDPSTLRGLEVFITSSGEKTGTLFDTLNTMVSAPGSRLLERLLHMPLMDLAQIRRRQSWIGTFIKERTAAEALRESLKAIRDIPRILTRLKNNRRHPRELGGLAGSLSALPYLTSILQDLLPQQPQLKSLLNPLLGFDELSQTLAQALAEALPQALGDSPTLRDGYDSQLDELRGLTAQNESWITAFEFAEQQATGIKSLKVKHHGSLGYCIEVTKANAGLVPAHYIRRQSTSNHERFTTEPLRQRERLVFEAKDKALMREIQLFEALVQTVLQSSGPLYACSEALAYLDVFIGLADTAYNYQYTCPHVEETGPIEIEAGRHPVVEARLASSRHGMAGATAFTPNSLTLGLGHAHIALITGPNMAGKSTFIRQNALIVLLAQIGSWVPAKQVKMGLVDRMFARIGASDELSKGHSTFMVEMAETAHLIHQSTSRSLILLDEVGRGTSTYDGLSLAWAIVEHLHQAGTRTLFATHYHELTQLEGLLTGLKNCSMLVHEEGETIHFLHQVVAGAASRSYGIHVAKLAGLPASIVQRAQAVLQELEAEGRVLIELLESAPKRSGKPRLGLVMTPQLSLFPENGAE